jgi:hypothetical protein
MNIEASTARAVGAAWLKLIRRQAQIKKATKMPTRPIAALPKETIM